MTEKDFLKSMIAFYIEYKNSFPNISYDQLFGMFVHIELNRTNQLHDGIFNIIPLETIRYGLDHGYVKKYRPISHYEYEPFYITKEFEDKYKHQILEILHL